MGKNEFLALQLRGYFLLKTCSFLKQKKLVLLFSAGSDMMHPLYPHFLSASTRQLTLL